MKTNDLKEVRRLLRAANGATWRIDHLRRAISKFMVTDDDNKIHIGEEDAFTVEQLEEEIREAMHTVQLIIADELAAVLGINIYEDMEGEPSMEEAYREYEAALVIESAKRRRSAAA